METLFVHSGCERRTFHSEFIWWKLGPSQTTLRQGERNNEVFIVHCKWFHPMWSHSTPNYMIVYDMIILCHLKCQNEGNNRNRITVYRMLYPFVVIPLHHSGCDCLKQRKHIKFGTFIAKQELKKKKKQKIVLYTMV